MKTEELIDILTKKIFGEIATRVIIRNEKMLLNIVRKGKKAKAVLIDFDKEVTVHYMDIKTLKNILINRGLKKDEVIPYLRSTLWYMMIRGYALTFPEELGALDEMPFEYNVGFDIEIEEDPRNLLIIAEGIRMLQYIAILYDYVRISGRFNFPKFGGNY